MGITLDLEKESYASLGGLSPDGLALTPSMTGSQDNDSCSGDTHLTQLAVHRGAC